MTPRPPLSVKIIYAIGQLGWSLAMFGAANLLVYFYMPPETSESAIFPTYIFQGAILGIITIIGLLNFSGRIFDAITDPLIANWSDNSSSSFGKRKKLMAIAAVPFALFSFLIFYPLSTEAGMLNTIWLFVSILLFYFFLTLYTIPYTALISELGHHPDDRMLISTIISVTFAMGAIIGANAYAIQGALEDGTRTATEAFQMTMGIFAIASLIFMLIPVLFLNENKYCVQQVSSLPVKQSIRAVFNNKNFRVFAIGDLFYWLAITFIQLGVSYYITLLLDMDKAAASNFLNIAFLTSFALYVPINILVKKYGKKAVLKTAYLALSIIFLFTALLGIIPIGSSIMFWLLSMLSGYTLGCFGIIPNAIVADIVYENEATTGQQQSGMFFAARNFMMKMGISVANLVFPSLLLLGKSMDNPMGVRASAILAVIFCVVGYFFFVQYQEKASPIES